MRIQNIFAITTLVLMLVTSCKNNAPQEQGAPSYKLMSVKKQSEATSVSYSASIRGKQDIDIFPQVGGYLSIINVNEGEQVKRGDVLFVIEQAPYKAALKGAQASVEMAKSGVSTAQLNYDNAVNLNSKDIISDVELQMNKNSLDNATAQLLLAESQLMTAQTNLDFTVIKSPANGIVGKLPYRQGALVSANLPNSLTVISDNSQMYVYFSMSETQVLDMVDIYGSLDNVVEAMSNVELQLNNGSIYPHKGYVESISGVIESTTGAVSVRAVFPNKERRLLSGGAGNVIVPVHHNNVVVIPKTATFEIQNKIFVYKVVDGKAKSTIIEVAQDNPDRDYIVTKGINEGDEIVAEGAGLVREGTIVK